MSRLQKADLHCHYEPVKVDNGAAKYCMKEETRVEGPYEFGIKPVVRSSKTDWEEVKEKAKAGKMDEIPADIFVKHYRNLKAIKKDYMTFEDHTDVRGIWYWGKTGLGKSKLARERYPDFYPKLCNKWWDGY